MNINLKQNPTTSSDKEDSHYISSKSADEIINSKDGQITTFIRETTSSKKKMLSEKYFRITSGRDVF